MNTVVVIPAYKPTERLVDLVATLDASDVGVIAVVDDGSGPEFQPVFDRVRQFGKVRLLRHAVNLGKGAALKTAINHCVCEDPDAIIVTADADGQHLPDDIIRVGKLAGAKRDALVLGTRMFDGEVPLRSRLGNEITKRVLRLVLGYALNDTQTGLRAIPARLAPELLKIASRGYEFELDMLIACKQFGVPIVQTTIQTVYLDGNSSSHFNPLLDSMRIYFALMRFLFTSLTAALLDNVAFAALFAVTAPLVSPSIAILASQAGARVAATTYNYAAVKRLVFASRQSHTRLVPKYLGLVIAAGAVSYMMIAFLAEELGMNVLIAKVLAESILFFPNFVIQRDLVFRRRTEDEMLEPGW